MDLTNRSIIDAYNHAIQSRLDKPLCDICCWWCTYPFDHTPISVPFKYDEKRCKFHIEGYFCSWQCGKAYVLAKNTADMYNQCTLITLLQKRFSGSIKSIRAAPSRFALEKFGGKMSIEEFRKDSSIIDSVKLKNEIFEYNPLGKNVNKGSTTNVIHTIRPQNDKNTSKKQEIANSPHLLNEDIITRGRRNISQPTLKQSSKTTLENFMQIKITK
tara:strand:- start:2886 stop:3530 length:645 start_codon:yes stop_codon:yes gene_type:complete